MNHRIVGYPRHVSYRIEHESLFKTIRKIPRNHLAARDVFHNRKIRKGTLEMDVRDIGTEDSERNRLVKCTIQCVGECSVLQSLLHDCLVRVSFSNDGDETVLSHDPLYLLVIHRWKPHFDASPAVFPFATVKDFFDLEVVGVVFVWHISGFEPLVVSASGDTR